MKVLSTRELEPPPIPPAREGVHLSDVIRYILIAKDKEKYGGKIDTGTRLRWESGFLWELVFSRALAHRMGHEDMAVQQPRVKDGIIGTLDFFDRRNHIVKEMKWTLLSAVHDILSSKLWHFRVQVQGYAFMWDTDRADLTIFHAMGTYERPADGGLPRPVANEHRLRFNRVELQRNWDMCRVNRDALVKSRNKSAR